MTKRKMAYRAFGLHNIRELTYLDRLSNQERQELEVAARVFPFRVSNYVTEQLIDWSRVPDDPIYTMTFPNREMLKKEDYENLSNLVIRKADSKMISHCVNDIRSRLNPHPGGQKLYNVPRFEGNPLQGVQHKYKETVLFFPAQGQTCHSYCTFCFRWPQFTENHNLHFGSSNVESLIRYLKANPQVTDLLITGGDPMIMNAKVWKRYIDPLLAANLPNLQTIRIGTRALTFWPYRFLTDSDSDAMFRIFERIVRSGKHLAIMAHINHPRELMPQPVREAIRRLRNTGAQIRTQSPIIHHINDHPDTLSRLWDFQVKLGLIPYYMFIPRDTGAQHYFSLPLVNSWKIFRDAYLSVSGLSRTVRGPIMSSLPGKIQVLGVSNIGGEEVMVLTFLQARNPDWVGRPFFARLNDEAKWLSDLQPAFGEETFFYEQDMEEWEDSVAPKINAS